MPDLTAELGNFEAWFLVFYSYSQASSTKASFCAVIKAILRSRERCLLSSLSRRDIRVAVDAHHRLYIITIVAIVSRQFWSTRINYIAIDAQEQCINQWDWVSSQRIKALLHCWFLYIDGSYSMQSGSSSSR